MIFDCHNWDFPNVITSQVLDFHENIFIKLIPTAFYKNCNVRKQCCRQGEPWMSLFHVVRTEGLPWDLCPSKLLIEASMDSTLGGIKWGFTHNAHILMVA